MPGQNADGTSIRGGKAFPMRDRTPNVTSHTFDALQMNEATLIAEIATHHQRTNQLRQHIHALSQDQLATLIPHGPYCYSVLGPLPPSQIGHHIQPCPFLMGTRPETTCFFNPDPLYAIDTSYNPDACKRCGINDVDEMIDTSQDEA